MADSTVPETRAIRPDEADAFLGVLCDAFRLDYEAARPIFYRDPLFDLSHKRILETPGQGILSCLTVIPAQIQIGEAWVPMGGIAGVATRQVFQRQGHAGLLLEHTVQALPDELGYPVSALLPFSSDYYRRFGWEQASDAVRWRGTPADLPSAMGARPAEIVAQNAPERRDVHRFHAERTRGRTGACLRDDRRWQVIEEFVPGREMRAVYGYGRSVEGYALWERSAEASAPLRILEMSGATDPARRSLLAALAGSGAGSFEWVVSPRGLTEFGLTGGETQPGMMFRICDLRAALAALHAACFAPALGWGEMLTIRGADPLRPRNGVPACITREGIAEGLPQAACWIAADICALAPCFTGYRTPSQLAAEGRLTASDPDALALADRLFPARQPFLAPADQF